MKKQIVCFCVFSSVIYLAGCGQLTTGSTPTLPIQTHVNISGVTQNWANAQLSGYTLDAPCPSNSSGCITNFGNGGYNYFTDSNGYLGVATNALPATWYLAAQDAANSTTCPAGASAVFPNQGVAGPNMDLYCGTIDPAASITASQSYCTKTVNSSTGQTISNTCKSTITLTAPSSLFPTSRAMTASIYNEAETLISSSSVTATSSVQVVVPTPTTVGVTLVALVDPSTNLPLGAILFTYNYVLQNPSCGTMRSC